MSAGRGERLAGRDIVCVGFAEWDAELHTNQHHIMSRLAADNRVLFIESLGLRQPRLQGRDLRRIARRLVTGLRGVRTGRDGVHVLSPLVVPLHRFAAVRRLNALLLRFLVHRAVARLGLREAILWAYVPQADVLVDVLEPALVVYHCVDDIAAGPGIDAGAFRAAEARFVPRCDLVLTSAPSLGARMRTLSDHVVDAPNVADTTLFAGALEPGPVDPAVAALPAPRAVFTGAVAASKLDFPLIAELARLRPGWSFALVGPIGSGDPGVDVSILRAEPNVHLLGWRAHDDLPAVLRGGDAGLIPYAQTPFTAGILPMKLFEYLAAGLPVIATPLPSLAGVDDVATAPDAAGLAALLDAAQAIGPEARAERSRRAQAHSWDTRLQEIGRAVAAATERRRDAARGRPSRP